MKNMLGGSLMLQKVTKISGVKNKIKKKPFNLSLYFENSQVEILSKLVNLGISVTHCGIPNKLASLLQGI